MPRNAAAQAGTQRQPTHLQRLRLREVHQPLASTQPDWFPRCRSQWDRPTRSSLLDVRCSCLRCRFAYWHRHRREHLEHPHGNTRKHHRAPHPRQRTHPNTTDRLHATSSAASFMTEFMTHVRDSAFLRLATKPGMTYHCRDITQHDPTHSSRAHIDASIDNVFLAAQCLSGGTVRCENQ